MVVGGDSQYVTLVRGPVDGQLVGKAGHVGTGSVLQQELHTVQVSIPSCVVQDCVPIGGLGIHVPT